MFQGRTKKQKARMYEEIVKELYERLEIQATDVFIVIHEPPNENWGLAGKQVNLAVLSVVIYVA